MKRVAILSAVIDLLIGAVALVDARMLPLALAWTCVTLLIVLYGYLKYNQGVFTKGNVTLGIAGVIITAIAYMTVMFETQFEGMAVGVSIVKIRRLAANTMNKSIQITKIKDIKQFIIRGKGDTRMKDFLKWVFVSNPKTWCMIFALGLAIATALLGYFETLDWGVATPLMTIFFTAIGGLLAAHRTGFETNKEADERKCQEAKKTISETKAKKHQEEEGDEINFSHGS